MNQVLLNIQQYCPDDIVLINHNDIIYVTKTSGQYPVYPQI